MVNFSELAVAVKAVCILLNHIWDSLCELHGVIKIKIIEHNSVNIYVLHVDFYFYDGILKLDIFRRAEP